MEPKKPYSRRDFISRALGVVGATILFPIGIATAISPEEKRTLKEQLQRELERKVYNVNPNLFKDVNRARNPKKLEGHEKSHVPKIVAPSQVKKLEPFTVRIEVGEEEIHEMNPFHYVDWIALYADDLLINQVLLTPFYNQPIITFTCLLERSTILRALEHCNLHGTWEAQMRIDVS